MKKPNGYWNEKTNIIKELELIINKKGVFPPDRQLPRILASSITKHGGINHFRSILKCKINKKSAGYWDDYSKLKNFILENFPSYIKNGIFPSSMMLKNIGLNSATLSKHGGMIKIASEMKCELESKKITSDGHYVDSSYEYILDEYLFSRDIIHDVHVLISDKSNYVCDFKIADWYIEIWGYGRNDKSKRGRNYNIKREKKEILYEKSNLNLCSIECEIFNYKWEKLQNHLDSIFKNIGFDVSKKHEIEYHTMLNKCNGHAQWNDSSIIKELNIIIQETGKFPGRTYLIKNKRSDLIHALQRNGGSNRFRRILSKEPL